MTTRKGFGGMVKKAKALKKQAILDDISKAVDLSGGGEGVAEDQLEEVQLPCRAVYVVTGDMDGGTRRRVVPTIASTN
ncbi:MAG: hypothetical protein F6K65_32800 [Moorea sp. SIO3C2]|nr:hypothetical protein [Moorena sp. SIO3C2]